MIELYPHIKWVHVAAVVVSGVLFALRGAAVQSGAPWAMAAPLRYLSYSIDTVLLASALMLSAMVHQYPFVHGWLTAKVVLLVIYIVLGTYALKRGRTRSVRLTCWLGALVVYLFIISIARSHDPLGWFTTLMS